MTGAARICLAAAALPAAAAATEPLVVVERPDALLDGSRPERPHVEPWVTADPADPDHLLAGAIVTSAERGGPWSCAAFSSSDGGERWTRHDFAMERCIDPWLLPLPDGGTLFTGIEIQDGHEAEQRLRLVAFRSGDGGATWSQTPLDLGRGHDHAMLARAPDGAVVVVSQRTRRSEAGRPRHRIGVLRSEDGGRSFAPAAEVAPSNLALVPTGVLPLGDALVVSFLDFQRDVDGFGSEGGLRRPRAWLLRSDDGGGSFSEPLFASEACGPSDGFAGYPALAAARSGAHRGRLYHLCVREGFDGLALSHSDDGGARWSEPVRLARGPGSHVRTPMLAVDRAGAVAAAWYDRSDDESAECQDVYVAASADGGASFGTPLRVSTATSCPDTPGNGRAARSWPMGGDYGSLAAGGDGTVHLLWADSRSGVFQIHGAALRVATGGDAAEAE